MPSGPKKRKAAKKKGLQTHPNPSSRTHGDEEEENGLGGNPEVGGYHSDENIGQEIRKEGEGNIPVESQAHVEDTIVKENGRFGHEEVSGDVDEEDRYDGVIPDESQVKPEDTIFQENGISEHEEISRDADEAGHCDGVILVESDTKIEDTANKENERSEHEEVGRDIDVEDQCNSVNGDLAEEDLVDPVKVGVTTIPTDGDIHIEDGLHEESGRSEQEENVSSRSNAAEDQPNDIKDPEEDFSPVGSWNGEVGEAPAEEFENEEIRCTNYAEDYSSAIEGNQAHPVDSLKTANTSLAGQVHDSMDQESADSVAENGHLVVPEKSLPLTDREEDTSNQEKPCSPLVTEHVVGENGDGKAIAMDEKLDILVLKDIALVPEERILKDVEDNSTNESKDFMVDGKLIHSNITPITSAYNGAAHNGDLGATAYEPLLIAPPPALQKTSWKGCCGLFEAFKRSG